MGGKAVRLGGVNKSGLIIGQSTGFEHVIDRLQTDCDPICLSAASPSQLAGKESDYLVLYDAPSQTDLDGVPNALLTIFKWAQASTSDFIVTTTADTPFLPQNFVSDLKQCHREASDASLPVVSTSGKRLHGIHALWPRGCFTRAAHLIEQEGVRSVTKLHRVLGSVPCHFDTGVTRETTYDPFFNINTPKDLETALEIASQLKANSSQANECR